MDSVLDFTDYPDNYDWLPQETKNKILDFFNTRQKEVDDLRYKRFKYDNTIYYKSNAQNDEQLANHKQSELYVARNALRLVGIFVEYGWLGNSREWILVNYDRALSEYERIRSIEEF